MKKFIKLFGVIALAAVIGFSFMSCIAIIGGNDNKPGIPSNLKQGAYGTAQLAIEWDKVPDADGYYVYKRNNSGDFIKMTKDVIITENTNEVGADIFNLTSNTSYTFKVSAYNSYGEGGLSSPITHSTY